MSRKAKTNGSTALATIATAPSALQITRADANARIKTRETDRAGARQVRDASRTLLHGDGGVLSSHVSLFLERTA